MPQPKHAMEIFQLLDKSNCRECGAPTCMVCATMLAEGAKGVDQCPPLADAEKQALSEYLSAFHLSDS